MHATFGVVHQSQLTQFFCITTAHGLHRAAALLKRAGDAPSTRREQLVFEAARFSRLDEPFQQRLDALLEQSKTLSDGDYFAQVEHICAEREAAKRQLLLELSREAIQRHGL